MDSKPGIRTRADKREVACLRVAWSRWQLDLKAIEEMLPESFPAALSDENGCQAELIPVTHDEPRAFDGRVAQPGKRRGRCEGGLEVRHGAVESIVKTDAIGIQEGRRDDLDLCVVAAQRIVCPDALAMTLWPSRQKAQANPLSQHWRECY